MQQLADILENKKAELCEDKILIHSEYNQMDLECINRFLLDQHTPFIGIEIVQPALEDVFIRLTGKTGKGEKVCA